MKKIIILSLSFFLSGISLASSNLNTNSKEIITIPLNVESKPLDSFNTDKLLNFNKDNNLFGKCTIRVNITLEDGTKIRGKVTFHDVGFFECIGIKAANLWSKIF